MQLPGGPSLVFLGCLFILWPALAIKSSRKLSELRAKSAAGPGLLRETVWKSTLTTQAVMLLAAWWIGRGFGYDVFAMPPISWREMIAALAALAGLLLVRVIARASRTDAERRKLAVYALAPRSRREWMLWAAVVVMASLSEEAAYRGVAMNILWYSLGEGWAYGALAAALVALAFALAHWVQAWKSMVVIFVISLLMQALVVYTRTLVLAMIVHAAYDFIAGAHIAREARNFDANR